MFLSIMTTPFLNNICITWACHMKTNFVIPSDSAAIRRVKSFEFL